MGREEPAMSMDSSGKVMWAKHSEVQQANLKAMGDAEIRDGERLPLGVKDMGSCEIYPQTIQHSPNGRFVVVCGDGEYIIYTAMALRNKSFGSAQEFVWAHDSSQYAIREGSNKVKIFKNFKEKKAFKPDFGSEGIFGGFLLGVRSNSSLAFYDWESAELIRRVEIQPKHIFWSDSGELVCIATEESFFVLRYVAETVAAALEKKENITEDGIEDAFEVLGEVQDVVKTGVWVGDCFIYTSSVNRLNYYVGGEIITIAHMDRTMYLLGYIPKDDRLYLGDKELNVVSFSLLLSVLEYQTAVMRKDFSTADQVLPTIPKEQRPRVAHFLEKQGFKQQALAVTTDPEHKFELALQLGELKMAYQLAMEAESEHKWKQLAELATTKCHFSLAQECLHHAQDYGGLLLLATASGNTPMVGKLAEGADRDGKTNVAFLAYFMQGRLDKCLDLLIKTDRLPEAAFLARTYLPSHVSRVVKLWKESLSKVNQKAADALADPSQYSNLFPGLQQALLAEQYLKETHIRVRPAAEYTLITPNEDRNIVEESAGFITKEEPVESNPNEDRNIVEESAGFIAKEEPVESNAFLSQDHHIVEDAPEFIAQEETVESKEVVESAATAAVTESTPEEIIEEIIPVATPIEVVEHIDESATIAAAEKSTPEEIPVVEEIYPTATAPVSAPAEEEIIDVHQSEVEADSEDTVTAEEIILVAPITENADTRPEFVQNTSENEENFAPLQEEINEIPPPAQVAVSESSEIMIKTEAETVEKIELMKTEDVLGVTVETHVITTITTTHDQLFYERVEESASSEDPFLVQEATAQEENVAEIAQPSVAEEQLITFDTTAMLADDEPVPVMAQTLAGLSLDPILEPLVDVTPVLDPISFDKPDNNALEVMLTSVPEAESAGPEAAPAEIHVTEEETEAGNEPPEDLQEDDDDEGLDDLDLDNFDLDDIDTTDVNLDEDFSDENE